MCEKSAASALSTVSIMVEWSSRKGGNARLLFCWIESRRNTESVFHHHGWNTNCLVQSNPETIIVVTLVLSIGWLQSHCFF